MFGYCESMSLGGWLLMIGLWAVSVAIVVWIVGRLFPSPNLRAEAEDELARRLAAGEIDAQTYREVRKELTGTQVR